MILLLALLAILPDNLDELAAANKYDEALAVCAEAEKLALKAKDVDSVMRCREKKRELTFLKAQYDKVREADARLAADPSDAAAADTMGRFYLFVKWDWNRGMTILTGSKDPFLKALADKEASARTGPEKAAAGDAWVSGSAEIEAKGLLTGATATANVKADRELLARARGKMIERACYWWQQAWPLLQDKEREKLRERFRDAYAVKGAPPDRIGAETGWKHISSAAKFGSSQTYAHSGKQSVTVVATNGLMEHQKPIRLIPGKEYELSCWYLSTGTEGTSSLMFLTKDPAGKTFQPIAPLAPDCPFWQRTAIKFTVPDGVGTVTPKVVLMMNKGQLWIDDLSLTCEGRELIVNGSFE